MAKFLIVEARFYDHLNDMLVAGAKAAIKAAGHKAEVITVPGALEIPGAIALAGRACAPVSPLNRNSAMRRTSTSTAGFSRGPSRAGSRGTTVARKFTLASFSLTRMRSTPTT
ncbi:MAG: 6,7-dimethyl-8-ribityllumazine synthase [Proteobacteria bacterium]|nr:6,7-dimethyl-8-ribityllumazine synthase [Pseudomonadota bacterium]